MPTSKHTTKPRKLLSLHSTSISKRQQSGSQTKKAISAAVSAIDGVPEKHNAALNWRDRANGAPRLTEARARELTAEILKEHDDDKIVMDLIELLTGIAYDPVAIDRDSLAFVSTREAIMYAPAFSAAMSAFATKAAMRGSPAPSSAVVVERPSVFPIFAEGGSELGRNAACDAGRLCADYCVTLKSATQAFEEEMIAETLRFYPNERDTAALHLGITVAELGTVLRRIQRRQKARAARADRKKGTR
jgi:hypothetical protein